MEVPGGEEGGGEGGSRRKRREVIRQIYSICGTAVSALTVSDESITHELNTILAQSGGCHGHLTWTLTF